jgi:two-component system cell cycle sensor histidine kinase/response regulator CckA
MVIVADNGVGMPREVRTNAFDPFFTTKERGKGTGLGLSIVHGFVKHSHGAVELESEPGRGTTFRIYLPLAAAVDVAVRPATLGAEVRGSDRPPTHDRPPTVLVVDDERNVRTVVARLLARDGYRVMSSELPSEALEMAIALGPELDLLITDVLMPGMNGPELAERVREKAPNAKLLFISGYADGQLRDVLRDRTFPFLQKPFEPEAMRNMVGHLIGLPLPEP